MQCCITMLSFFYCPPQVNKKEGETMENKMFVAAELKEVNDEERTIVAWASKPIVDRQNEIIEGKAFDVKNFKKNPVLMLSHNYSQPPIGRVLWIKQSDEGMKFKTQFANSTAAEEIFDLYNTNFMRAFSVGFRPKKNGWEDVEEKGKTIRVYKDVELIEISCVSIGACTDALVEAYNEGKIKTKGLIEFIEKSIEEKSELDKDETEGITITEAVCLSTIEGVIKDMESETEQKPGWDENETGYRLRIRDPKRFDENTFKTVTLQKKKPQIKSVQGKLKGEDTMTIQSLIFPKSEGWTLADAKKWVNDHPDVKKDIDELIEDVEEFEKAMDALFVHVEVDTEPDSQIQELINQIEEMKKQIEELTKKFKEKSESSEKDDGTDKFLELDEPESVLEITDNPQNCEIDDNKTQELIDKSVSEKMQIMKDEVNELTIAFNRAMGKVIDD